MGQGPSAVLGENSASSMIDSINNLVATGAQAVACGPSCQADKLTASYYQAYIQAQQTLNTAPQNLDIAYKNYIVNSQGQAAYDQIIQDSLTQQANDIAKKLQDNFDQSMANAVAINDAYNASVHNFSNSNELYQDYVTTNKQIKHQHQRRRNPKTPRVLVFNVNQTNNQPTKQPTNYKMSPWHFR